MGQLWLSLAGIARGAGEWKKQRWLAGRQLRGQTALWRNERKHFKGKKNKNKQKGPLSFSEGKKIGCVCLRRVCMFALIVIIELLHKCHVNTDICESFKQQVTYGYFLQISAGGKWKRKMFFSLLHKAKVKQQLSERGAKSGTCTWLGVCRGWSKERHCVRERLPSSKWDGCGSKNVVFRHLHFTSTHKERQDKPRWVWAGQKCKGSKMKCPSFLQNRQPALQERLLS